MALQFNNSVCPKLCLWLTFRVLLTLPCAIIIANHKEKPQKSQTKFSFPSSLPTFNYSLEPLSRSFCIFSTFHSLCVRGLFLHIIRCIFHYLTLFIPTYIAFIWPDLPKWTFRTLPFIFCQCNHYCFKLTILICAFLSTGPLPTTQEKSLHMDITRWSILKSDWLYSLQPKMEKL